MSEKMNGTLCHQKEVEWVPERYIDSGLDFYNPTLIFPLSLSASGATATQLLRFAPQARATAYIQVRGAGALWLYLRQEGVEPGVTEPHLQITQALGIVTVDLAPGAYTWVANSDGAGACVATVNVIEREARKQRCAS